MPRSMMYRGHGAEGPVVSMRARRSGLRFTEWMLLLGIAWAYLFSISVPLFGIPLQITGLRHFPLIMLLPALALHLFALGILQGRQDLLGILKSIWPLMILAVWIAAASLVARNVLGIDDTFLTFGFYLLLLPLLALVPSRSGTERTWAKVILGLWLVVSCAALIGELARLPKTGALHELEYIVLSGFVAMWYLSKTWLGKALAVVLMIAAIGANYKLTGAILGGGILIYLAAMAVWRRTAPSWRPLVAIIVPLVALTIVSGLVVAYFEYRTFLPSGNPEVRLNQYIAAWEQFINSPVWGSAYLDGSGEDYREGYRLYNIPTHSDTLDLLKHGGLIGFSLFFAGYFLMFRTIVRAAVMTCGDRLMHAYFASVAVFQVGAFVTFSLNPLLLKAPYLLVIFGNLGLAVGLAVRMNRAGTAPDR
jgi:O-antigen ligase